MAFEGELCQKTVFVLDHCKQTRELTGQTIEIELGNRSMSLGCFQFIPSLMKSLWNCMAESTLEYARIVWDLFGDSRLIRFITSNPQKAISLNDWSNAQQNMTFAHEAFAAAGPPFNGPGSVQVGIISAIKALSEPTPFQAQVMKSVGDGRVPTKSRMTNKGRIVCITSCLTDFDIEEFIVANLIKNNNAALATDRKLPVDELEFVLISLHPLGKDHLSRVLSHPCKDIAPNAKLETHVLTPPDFYEKLQEICTAHHYLATTTVTGIPMKEEAASSSSLIYDVPLFHPRLSSMDGDMQILKWAGPTPPKGVGAHLCNSACRATPVDVISRPTTCLSNFVLSGRSVWLESLKKTTKSSCSVLLSHGGEIWIHVMETARNVLEDPPSISEGPGGRVTDYRIPDLVEFMKQNMICPYPPSSVLTSLFPADKNTSSSRRYSHDEDFISLKPFKNSERRLWRKTMYWPTTISSSVLFSLTAHLDNLLKLFPYDILDEIQKVECEKTFWSLMAIEARSDPPPLSSYQLKKGYKKDEQWRIVYAEIETFLRAHLFSEVHKSVLECFMESRRSDDKVLTTIEDPISSNSKNGDEPKLKRPPGGSNGHSSDSPPPPPSKKNKTENEKPRTNLLALWRLKTEKKSTRILPEGLKLYAHLKESQAASQIQNQNQDSPAPSAKAVK